MKTNAIFLTVVLAGLLTGEARSATVVSDDFSSYASGIPIAGNWDPKSDGGSQQDLFTGRDGSYAVLDGAAGSNYHIPYSTGFMVHSGEYAVVSSDFRYVYAGGGSITNNYNKNAFGLLVSTTPDWDTGSNDGFYLSQRGGAIGNRLPNNPWVEGWITHGSLGVNVANANTSNWFTVEWTIRDVSGSLYARATLTDGGSVSYSSTEIDLGIPTGTQLFAGYSTGPNDTGKNIGEFAKFSEIHIDNFEVVKSDPPAEGVFPLTDPSNQGGWLVYEPMWDEFDGATLNLEKWEPLSWSGRAPVYHEFNNVILSNGNAVLKTTWKDGPVSSVNETDYAISAGYFQSTTERRYGYFEIKCRALDFPMVTGWWMTGGGRAYTREIDMLECPSGVDGRKNEYSCNFHIWKTPTPDGVDDNGGGSIADPKHYTLPFNMVDDFHVYGFEWDKDVCKIYIDGVLYRTKATESFKVGQRLMVGNEYNKWFAPISMVNSNLHKVGATYDIEYVRSWIKPETDETWYVDAASGDDANDGTTWASAKKTIQGAVNEAYDGDSIWVAGGYYQEYVTFHGMNNLKVYGGFVNGDADLADRDHVQNPTIINAPQDGYSPVCIKGNNGFRLDGFTISGVSGNTWHEHGVDIHGPCANVVIANCRMIQNHPSAGGGSGTMTDGVDGADYGLALTQVRYENCEISGNTSVNDGTALSVVDGAQVEFVNTRIMNNSCSGQGGVLRNYSWNHTGNPNTLIRFENCLIYGNTNQSNKGVVSLNYGALELDRCTVVGNTGDGIELFSGSGATASVVNSALLDNNGEGFCANTSGFSLQDNLFFNNSGGHVYYGGNKDTESAINGMSQASGNIVADPNVALMTASDSDLDQMPDWWELQNNLDVTINDYESDHDSDGSFAGVEYVVGTDPWDPGSVFKLTGVPDVGNYRIYLDTEPGRIYSVDYTDDLMAGWSVLTNGIVGDGSVVEVVDGFALSNRFYKVNAEIP